MLRATSIFIKDNVVHSHIGVEELDSLLMADLRNIIVAPVKDKSQYVSTSLILSLLLLYPMTAKYYFTQAIVDGIFNNWGQSDPSGNTKSGSHFLKT